MIISLSSPAYLVGVRYAATSTNLTPPSTALQGHVYLKRATSGSFAPVALSYKRNICRSTFPVQDSGALDT